MDTYYLIISEILLISTITYWYLHYKTRIRLIFLLTDNLVVAFCSFIFIYLLKMLIPENVEYLVYFVAPIVVVGFAFGLTMIRFWRTPNRKIKASETEMISPADGNIIYIKKCETDEVPISIKNGLEAHLTEISQTDLLKTPCWLIGINMTPFDVHKNCAPMKGKIVLNKHISGKFLSLKHPKAIVENERNTLVIKNDQMTIGIIQTASKLVRRIDSYVKEGDIINKGDWFGMIRFGSQVDLIIPANCEIAVEIGEQIFAKKSIIAKF